MNNHIEPSIDPDEIAKFSALAEQWWDVEGKFRPLHQINPLRVKYILNQAISHFALTESELPLKNLQIIDIGCGGGILSEPICRLGAELTAIDASEKNINIAKLHASKMQLNINYQATSIEQIVTTGKKFDIVLNMEVIEHVADVESFLKACSQILKPNGLMFIATLNRTIKSYLLAIIGAEYILNWLPKGTHSWKKFLKPSEVISYLRPYNHTIVELKGMEYNLLKGHWYLTNNIDVNYIILCKLKNNKV